MSDSWCHLVGALQEVEWNQADAFTPYRNFSGKAVK